MNTVLNSYGQLYGCPEILKKVINFFVVGLTYGCLKVGNLRSVIWSAYEAAMKV